MLTYCTPLNHCIDVRKQNLLIALLSEENFANIIKWGNDLGVQNKSPYGLSIFKMFFPLYIYISDFHYFDLILSR